MKKTIGVLLGVFLMGFVGIYGLFAFYSRSTAAVDPGNTEKIAVEIQKGEKMSAIAADLKSKRLIQNDWIFMAYAKINGFKTFKSGAYELSKDMSAAAILQQFEKGSRPLGIKVTIPEGLELEEILKRLADAGFNQKELENLCKQPQELIAKHPVLQDAGIDTLEGFLFPDTYYFEKELPSEQILTQMVERFEKVYRQENFSQALEKRALSLKEFVTLASVVEREAVVNQERPVIAGIFLNRLQQKMPLQSCATVQYIIKDRKPVLSASDIQVDSPFNTYRNKGLPPAPIASPGLRSMLATAHPEDTPYLFFLAKGDGSHVFSQTYEEHLKAREKYIGK